MIQCFINNYNYLKRNSSEILNFSRLFRRNLIKDYVLHYHEWWNGGGYPNGLKGEKIPLMSRIACIADAYDVMTNERPYKRAMTEKEAIEELRRFAGIQFDPDLAEKFVSLINK